ncbi:energy transducer TonB [Luteimonas arsenica]|uniref:energy transducer TonB n=1 Tax=Luteimonas arsenica TaxID=1586242 RepID=UPI001FB768DA|nr:energy transducer TonB [Luteimonas arsenica]
MKGRFWTGVVLAVLATTVFAQGPRAVRKQVEASMLVTGSMMVEPDGRVSGWEVDRREELPDAVVGLVGKSMAAWRFEPVMVDGAPVQVKARMSLRVVMSRQDDDNYAIAIRSGYFGGDAMTPQERAELAGTDDVRKERMDPPRYPDHALRAGVKGTVYLVLKVGRDGRVEDVFAEQVNLRTVGSERQMAKMREMLARPSIAAARGWTFAIPTTGEDADEPFWTLRVPVDYMFGDDKPPAYGEWHAYIPGPRERAPWKVQALGPWQSPDAMLAGGVYQEGRELRLLTPLEG